MRMSKAMAAWLALLAAAFVLILALNLPGHLSVDSVISLAEGRTGQRITWGPPMYSAILGWFDDLRPGTELYLAASLGLLLGAWGVMAALRPRIAWTGPLLLLLAIGAPQLALYQGIVWKDVLFANLTIAAFVALAAAGRWWPSMPVRLGGLVAASVLLALAALVRQNGLVAIVMAALALAWIAGRASGRRSALAWGLAGLVLPVALMLGLDAVTPVREAPGMGDQDRGVRIVQQYDLAAAVAEDPGRRLPVLERADPGAVAALRAASPQHYSPTRVDTLGASPRFSRIWAAPDAAVRDQWIDMIVSDPVGYARRRAEVFRWVAAAPDIDACLPAYTGVAGPARELAMIDMRPRRSEQDGRLYNYATWFFDTPAMSHVAFGALALLVAGLLLVRREAADLAIVGLMGAALAFAASFSVISLACDYRYLYFLDLAAISGALYLALDPRLRRARR